MTVDNKIYRSRFSAEELGGKIELWQVLCRYWFHKFIPPDSRTLDLGAGACEFINNIVSAEKIAIDHNPDVTRFAATGIRCIVDELDAGLRSLPENSVDRIMVSNVFEHLPNKEVLFACLAEAYRVLTPGGKIIVMQPNIAAVRERFYDFSDHTLPLTEKGMAEALQSNGFEIEYLKARFLPYTTKSRYPRWPILVRMYLLFPPIHAVLGGQMFVVGGKSFVSATG